MKDNVKVVFKNTTFEQKEQFKNMQCMLLISVGQESHEGERFAKTIDLINSSFGSCTILLYDSLQRYSMSLNSTRNFTELHESATKQGNLWLVRNKKYYDKCTILKGISRWDSWIEHSGFLPQRDKLISFIESNLSYKTTFENTVDNYLNRYCKRLVDNEIMNFDKDRARSLCFEYLLEECTVLCLWPELRCEFEIYPNWHNNAIEATRKQFILPNYPNLLRALRIGFRNGKQIKAQHFELLDQY